MKHPARIESTTLDSLAIGVSVLCVLHCLITPLAVLASPILGASLWASHEFHAWLLVLILPSSALALYLGCRQHGSGAVLGLGVAGMGVLITAAILGPAVLTELGEVLMTGAGGILLAFSHVLNYRRCRRLRCEEQACGEHAAANA